MMVVVMSDKELIDYLDHLLFNEIGKHLDNLQLSILKGVLKGQKYSDIAEEYSCTTGHARDKGSELLKILSEALGEDINKSNFKATIERLGFSNVQSPIIGNKVKVRNINLCSNNEKTEKKDIKKKENQQNNLDLKIKIKTIKKLKELGLTNQQIAEALDLSIEEIENGIIG
ncbi:hypothetical protein [Geminocystis sp.]|uniref:hypothetical protein n=1 Tax=Geminocystis sp. TaxID=2664100 RepID=UPI003593346A